MGYGGLCSLSEGTCTVVYMYDRNALMHFDDGWFCIQDESNYHLVEGESQYTLGLLVRK